MSERPSLAFTPWRKWLEFNLRQYLLKDMGNKMYDLDQPSDGRLDPISWVTFQGLEHLLERLLSMGPDLNRESHPWYIGNPLHAAAMKGDSRCLKLLLAAGADPNIKGSNFFTLLAAASYKGHMEICKLLLQAGAEVNNSDALSRAINRGRLEICRLLLDSGADANECGPGKPLVCRPLWCAAGACGGTPRRIAIAKMLLEYGADVNAELYDPDVGTKPKYTWDDGRSGQIIRASIRGPKPELMWLLLKAGCGSGTHRGRILQIFRGFLKEERPEKYSKRWEWRRSIAPEVIEYLTQRQ